MQYRKGRGSAGRRHARKRAESWRRKKTPAFPQQDFPLGDCPACGKKTYPTRQACEREARRLYPDMTMRVYPCGDWWHMSSQDAATAERERDRHAGPAGE